MADSLSRNRIRSKYAAKRFTFDTSEVDYDVAANHDLFKSGNRASPDFDPTTGFDDGTRYNIRLDNGDDDLFIKFNDADNDPIFIAANTVFEEFNVSTRNIFLTSAETSGTAQVDEVLTTAEAGVKNVDTFTLKAAFDIDTATFPSVAGSTSADYLVVYDTTGQGWAIWLDKTGAGSAPTGAIYTALDSGHKGRADISGGTDAASVAAIVETAFNALTGFTAVITTDDTAANGTMTFTQVVRGPATTSTVHNANDSGAGSIAVAQTQVAIEHSTYVVTYDTSGNAWAAYANLITDVAEVDYFTFTTKAATGQSDWFGFWSPSDVKHVVWLDKSGTGSEPSDPDFLNSLVPNRLRVDISGQTTAAQVATAVYTALGTWAPSGYTFANGTSARVDITNTVKGAVSTPEVGNASGSGAGSITATVHTLGVDIDAEPTGAIWTAIPAARKTYADLKAATSVANTVTQFASALNSLTGWSSKFTSSGTNTLIVTNDQMGPVTNAVVKTSTDGTSTSSVAQTTLGVASALLNTWFKLYSRDAVSGVETVHGFWFNVNSEGTEPTDTEVDSWHSTAIAIGDTSTNVADKLEATIDAITGVFASNNTANDLLVTHSVKGPRKSPAQGSDATPFTLSTATPGVGANATTTLQLYVR